MIVLPQHSLRILGLIVTRLIGWGTTYYVPSVLVSSFERDLGLSRELVFAGISIMLVIGAGMAPATGRYFEQHGTRGAMVAGSLLTVAGLVFLSLATGSLSYLGAWVCIGVASALTLQNASNVAVAQMMGNRTRRVIGIMMLFTALSATLFWPITEYLAQAIGWRQTCLAYAALHLACALIHASLPVGRPDLTAPPATEAERLSLEGRLPVADRQLAFWLVAISLSLNGLVSWGLPLHLIKVFESGGLSAREAVAAAALIGPAQIAARLFDVVSADRVPIEKTSLLALGILPFACLIPVLFGVSGSMALLFVLIYGASSGALAMARATLPLILFGRRGYATMLGRLTVPQNLVFAGAPLLFALLFERLGTNAALIIAAVVQTASFLAMLVLVRRLGRNTPARVP